MGNSEYRKTIDYILDLIRSGMLQVGYRTQYLRKAGNKPKYRSRSTEGT